jgi:hypothetical protein
MGSAIVLLFSILIAVIPLSALFFITKGYLDIPISSYTGLELTDSQRLIFGGIAGVASVNLLLAAFVWAAWREPISEDKHPFKSE